MTDKKQPICVRGMPFGALRRGNYYYVDKTAAIRELLADSGSHVLLARPRRFGKTLMMTMLRAFLELDYTHPGAVPAARRQFFEGLAIAGDEELCSQHLAQHPVVFLSLKTVEGRDCSEALGQLKLLISRLYTAFQPCFDNAKTSLLSHRELQTLECYYDLCNTRDVSEIRELLAPSLAWLCMLLHRIYSRSVYVLIDEYDTPLNEAYASGYEQDMLRVMRSLLHPLLKYDDEDLNNSCDLCHGTVIGRCLLTGCLRVGKASIFTGANNVTVLGMEDDRCSTALGFTSDEVKSMLEYYDLGGSAQAVRDWYDGYRCGSRGEDEIYCPWSIASFCAAARHSPGLRPQNYWIDSSSNAILNTVMDELDDDGLRQLHVLLQGGSILVELQEAMAYGELRTGSCDAFFSLLYLTGYLTRAAGDNPAESNDEDAPALQALRIPNREIRSCLRQRIWQYFRVRRGLLPGTAADDCIRFLTALEHSDAQAAQLCLQALLTAHLPQNLSHGGQGMVRPEREWIYAMFLHFVLLTASAGRIAQLTMERELGDGRADESFIFTRLPDCGCVIELKLAATADEEALEIAARRGLTQILERRYGEGLLCSVDPPLRRVLCFGIGCVRRKCKVVSAELSCSGAG